jgi:hypothetical protein
MPDTTPPVRRFRTVAQYTVELRWHAPRTWRRQNNLPHGDRFYAWALFASPSRKVWTHTEPTGNIRSGGIETVTLVIVTAEDDPHVPEIVPGEAFELGSGFPGWRVAAHGRVLARVPESN